MFDVFYQKLEELMIVPVVVIKRECDAVSLADALSDGGMLSSEVTFRTSCAAACIASMRRTHPEMLVGAGTVLTTSQVDEAVQAGAQFIVSPGFDEEVVDHCIELGIPVRPGTVTPSEVIEARKRGLAVTKFFPAEQYGGVKAIESLHAPFSGHRFMPTGGISEANVVSYLKSPAVIACGGTWMVKPSLIENGEFEQVAELARRAMELARSAR